ncbi:hypothetical protein DFH09DRAFT_1147796 [Mycena vulgaris]|nr:hypothetical protein DFH09DRAFT_1147796 [Mycena vulgaris]
MWLTKLALAISLPSALGATQQVAFQPIAAENPVLESSWNDLNARPDANTTGHLIFDTVNSLLQHWPNMRYRNGHNIIPGMVPVDTLIYHGRANNSVPDIPEWTATDPEHAYPFCGGPPENTNITGCWQFTFVATRPLKVLYFDGSSAANMPAEGAGTLDAQDLLVWGKVDASRWLDERARINDLCAWGREFGIDGYVREIMLCEFTGGVELLSTDFLAAAWARHVTPPLWDSASLRTPNHTGSKSPPPPGPLPFVPRKNDSEIAAGLRARNIINFEIMRAGSWHNHYPGETRIVLDLTRLISFYDTALAPSLIGRRAGLERWDHRLEGISAMDLETVTTRLRAVLASDANVTGSGVDWKTLYRLLEYLLDTMTGANVLERGETIQEQLRVMLMPYLLYAAHPAAGSDASDVWTGPVWRGSATRHTAYIHASQVLSARMTPSERLLLGALDETSREICRVVVRMWAAGVRAGLDPLIPLETGSQDAPPHVHTVLRVVDAWRADAHTLIAWLDWSVWVTCRPVCGAEEMCYLPTWPWFLLWDKEEDPEPQPSWKRPQPRCVRLFKPYSVL